MTLGEKIRQARKGCALSQEQLAEKMCVSRSAIAKWETDKGMPDIENLRALSRLLQVSLDELLNDSEQENAPQIRENFDPEQYGRGCKKVKKDRYMRQRFPDARIWTLLGRAEPTIAERMHSGRSADKEFYLVEQAGKQLFVTVTDKFMEAREMETPLTQSSFRLGSWHFIRCNYEIGE